MPSPSGVGHHLYVQGSPPLLATPRRQLDSCDCCCGLGTRVSGRLQRALPQTGWHCTQSSRAGHTPESNPLMPPWVALMEGRLPWRRCPSRPLSQAPEAGGPGLALLLYSPERAGDSSRPSKGTWWGRSGVPMPSSLTPHTQPPGPSVGSPREVTNTCL